MSVLVQPLPGVSSGGRLELCLASPTVGLDLALMSGLVLKQGNIPVGYHTPSFPSLSRPVYDSNPYTSAMLYSQWDIYRFTVIWFVIISSGLHTVVALTAGLFRRKLTGALVLIALYTLLGGLFGFAAGSIVGALLGAIYVAGQLHMSTWVPFGWAWLVMVFMMLTSYPTTAYTL